MQHDYSLPGLAWPYVDTLLMYMYGKQKHSQPKQCIGFRLFQSGHVFVNNEHSVLNSVRHELFASVLESVHVELISKKTLITWPFYIQSSQNSLYLTMRENALAILKTESAIHFE